MNRIEKSCQRSKKTSSNPMQRMCVYAYNKIESIKTDYPAIYLTHFINFNSAPEKKSLSLMRNKNSLLTS